MRSRRGRASLGIVLLIFAQGTSAGVALAATLERLPKVAKVVPLAGPKITGLTWAPELDVEVITEGPSRKVVVHLKGTYLPEDWSLLLTSGATLKLSKEKSFDVKMQVLDGVSKFSLTAVGPLGGLQTQVFRVDFVKNVFAIEPIRPPPRGGILPELNFTFLNYEQTSVAAFSEKALTLKVSGNYWIKPQVWDVGVSGYYNAFAFSSSSSNEYLIRFLGLNIRGGYTFPFVRPPWQLRLLFGGYYITTFANATFGFSHLVGPQLYPVVSRGFRNGGAASVYFKFSPIVTEASLVSFSSREMAVGAGYSHPLKNGKAITASIGMAWLGLNLSTSAVKTNSLSVGGGYRF